MLTDFQNSFTGEFTAKYMVFRSSHLMTGTYDVLIHSPSELITVAYNMFQTNTRTWNMCKIQY